MKAALGLAARFFDFFSLREEAKAHAAMPPHRVDALRAKLDWARETLREAGASEESLDLAEAARQAQSVSDAWRDAGSDDDPPALVAAARALGATPKLGPASRGALNRLERMLLTDVQRAVLRAWRTLTVTVVASAAVALVVHEVRLVPRPIARASGTATGKFSPEQAVDRDNLTEWALPDDTPGWLELVLRTPRSLKRVTIVNGRNRNDPARGMREYTLTLFSNGAVVQATEGTFEPYTMHPSVHVHEVQSPAPIDLVRITVRGWHGKSGSISEVILE
jgi:hypothetical protein